MAAWQSFFCRKHLALAPLAASFLSIIHQSSPLQLESATPEKVREPFTGIEFDWKREIAENEAKGNYHLLGTAVRCMLGQEIIKVCEEDHFQEFLTAQTPRSLVLIMDQDVAGHHIAKGFDRSLLPRIRKAQGGKSGLGKDALREFTHCFNQEKMLRKGSEICLVWRPDDTLVIMIDSRCSWWSRLIHVLKRCNLLQSCMQS